MGARSTPRRITHIPALDGMRAICVGVVVASHLALFVPDHPSLRLRGGFLGVDGFFVLSGFLITSLLLREQAASGSIRYRAFFGRRALRLLPALFTLLAVHIAYVAVTDHPGLEVPGLERANIVAIVFYYWNWRIAFNAPQSIMWPGDLKHLWSLSVEEQFYVVWPFAIGLVLTVTRRVRLEVAIVAAAIVAVAVHRAVLWHDGVGFYELYHRTDTRADALLVGALLGLVWVRWELPRRHLAVAGWAAAAFLVWAIATVTPQDPALYEAGLFTWIALAWAIVLWCIVEDAWALNRLLTLRWVRAVGIVSYGIYLWHLPIFAAVGRADLGRPALVEAGLSLVLTAAAVLASWYLIEQPFLRIKARLEPGARTGGAAP